MSINKDQVEGRAKEVAGKVHEGAPAGRNGALCGAAVAAAIAGNSHHPFWPLPPRMRGAVGPRCVYRGLTCCAMVRRHDGFIRTCQEAFLTRGAVPPTPV